MTEPKENQTADKTYSAKKNFYEYVNHKWLNDPANSIPGDYSRWGGFVKLHDQSLIDQIDLIRELSNKPYDELNIEQKKIVAIWKAAEDRFSKCK